MTHPIALTIIGMHKDYSEQEVLNFLEDNAATQDMASILADLVLHRTGEESAANVALDWLANRTRSKLEDDIDKLRSLGFVVGTRDKRVNTDFAGDLMVCEPYDDEQLPTRDGANGPWCVVGYDISELVALGMDFGTGLLEN